MRSLTLCLLVALAIYTNAHTLMTGGNIGTSGFNVPISEIVRKYGYPFEEHEVVTPDGYILLIHRIPHGRQQQMSGTMKRMPVFLQHGLLSSSDSWLLNEPEISLPYLLADAGFDVWMGNTRGNIYGRRHRTMTPTQPEFWNFSWDDIARQDVPTMVNYIVKLTDVPIESVFGRTTGGLTETQMLKNLLRQSGQNVGNVGAVPLGMRTGGIPSGIRSGSRSFMNPLGKLHYIGHSEGSLLGFVQFGRDKDLASKVGVFVALSPIGTMGVGQTPITNLMRSYDISKILSQPEVLSNKQFRNFIAQFICSEKGVFDPLCQSILHPETTRTGISQTGTIPFYFSHWPAGTSSKNLMHYIQLAKTGNLQGFDYGTPEQNQFFYKQNVPPQYKLSDVNVPVVLFYGNKDWLVSDKDFENLRQNLPNVVSQDLINKFGHLDFVVAKDAKDLVYDKIIKLLLTQQI